MPLLTYLSQRGYISLVEAKKSDSTSCWRMHRPLDIDGIAIQGVRAANEDPFMRAMYLNILAWPRYFCRNTVVGGDIFRSLLLNLGLISTASIRTTSTRASISAVLPKSSAIH